MKKPLKIILAVLAVGATAAMVGGYMALSTPSTEAAERIYVPEGCTTNALSDTLSSHFGSGYARAVMGILRLSGGRAEDATGSYVVEPGDRAIDLARRLKHRRQTPVRLTFSAVRTLNDAAEQISRHMSFTSDDFLAACDSLLPERGFKRPEFMAAFIPDTYEMYWTASAAATVKRLADQRDAFWSDERRQQAAALGLTPVQVATLASIVDEETARRDERPKVARLYLNRLHRGMPLQADPTVKYAVGDPTLRRIRGEHLKVQSPYNTYIHRGLPPGPIRLTDRLSLQAVLEAPESSYIYMCASIDRPGYHDFTADYATHLANARRYHAWLNNRGIH